MMYMNENIKHGIQMNLTEIKSEKCVTPKADKCLGIKEEGPQTLTSAPSFFKQYIFLLSPEVIFYIHNVLLTLTLTIIY